MRTERLVSEAWRVVKVLLVLLVFALLAAQPIPEDTPGFFSSEELHEP